MQPRFVQLSLLGAWSLAHPICYVLGCSVSTSGCTGDVTSPLLSQQAQLPHVFKITRWEVSAFWVCRYLLGAWDGHRPMSQGGGSISQSAAGIQKIFQWCFYHPTLCSYLFHYINCSSKGDLPRLRNHFSLICLPSLVMLKCSSTRDDITAVSENSFQN